MLRHLAFSPDRCNSERRRRRDNRHYVNEGDRTFRGCVQATRAILSAARGLTARGEVAYTVCSSTHSLARHDQAPPAPRADRPRTVSDRLRRPLLPGLGRWVDGPLAVRPGVGLRPERHAPRTWGQPDAHSAEGLTPWGCYDRMEGLGLSPEPWGLRAAVRGLAPSPSAGRRSRLQSPQRRVPCVYLYIDKGPPGGPVLKTLPGSHVFVAFLFSACRSPERRRAEKFVLGAERRRAEKFEPERLGSKKLTFS